jgi:hypothetical protein
MKTPMGGTSDLEQRNLEILRLIFKRIPKLNSLIDCSRHEKILSFVLNQMRNWDFIVYEIKAFEVLSVDLVFI